MRLLLHLSSVLSGQEGKGRSALRSEGAVALLDQMLSASRRCAPLSPVSSEVRIFCFSETSEDGPGQAGRPPRGGEAGAPAG